MIIVLVITKEKSLGIHFNQENWMLVIWILCKNQNSWILKLANSIFFIIERAKIFFFPYFLLKGQIFNFNSEMIVLTFKKNSWILQRINNDVLLPQMYIFSSFKGGPLVNWIPTKDRFYLIGIVSGSFFDCSNKLPGIFVQVDEISVLNFLRKEIFGDDPIQLGIQGLLYLEGWELFFYLFFL